MRHSPLLSGLVAVALIATACSGGDDDVVPTLPTTVVPETAAAAAAATPECGDAVASYQPTFTLPAGGNMPEGTYLHEIQERGRLIVGVSADTLQFGARNPISGEIEGFDIDILHEIADAIFGVEDAPIEFRVMNYAQRLPSLENGSVDLVAHTMTINCARWERIAFSTVYFDSGQKVLVPTDSPAQGLPDLAGKRVCVPGGSTNLENLQQYNDGNLIDPTGREVIGDPVEIVEVPDQTDCLVQFQQSSVDAITADDTVLFGFAAQDPYAHVVGDAFSAEPYGVGASLEHPELTEFVNLVLEQLRTNGRWTEIYEKWVSPYVVGATPEPPAATYGRMPPQ